MEYSIIVSASTSVGGGTFSASIIVRTPDDCKTASGEKSCVVLKSVHRVRLELLEFAVILNIKVIVCVCKSNSSLDLLDVIHHLQLEDSLAFLIHGFLEIVTIKHYIVERFVETKMSLRIDFWKG